jgi:hypothetical protein
MGGKAWNIAYCKVIGQPGTLITNGTIYVDTASTFSGGILRFEDVYFSGKVSIVDAAVVSITRGGVGVSGGLYIEGSSVSFKSVPVDINPSPAGIVTSNVSFEDASLSHRMTTAFISDSIVSLRRSSIGGMYHCPQMKNTTLTLVDSSTQCSTPEEPWLIQDSVLKLTRSSLYLSGEGYPSSSFEIAGSVVNATCADGSTIASYDGDAAFTNCTMHFANCSCQMNHGITVGGSLSITGGSLTYGKCEKWPSKTLPVSMLV